MAPKKKDLSQMTAFISQGHVEQSQLRPEQRGITPPPAAPAVKAAPTSKRFTVNMDVALIEECSQMVANTLGLTLSSLVEEALRKELATRVKATSPQSSAAPKKGRPVVIKG